MSHNKRASSLRLSARMRTLVWLLLAASGAAHSQGDAPAPATEPRIGSPASASGPVDSIWKWLSRSGSERELLPWNQPFRIAVRAREANTLVAKPTPAPIYRLDRDRIFFTIAGPPTVTIAHVSPLPKGDRKADATFGTVDVFHRPVEAIIALEQSAAPHEYIWTGDSISMGEDRPTYQLVEQLASFRALPGMVLLRPASANEMHEAWRLLMQLTDRPASLVLLRRALPTLDRSRYASATGVARGAYVLADAQRGKPDVLLLLTGSEVALCITAYEQLKGEGIHARVVGIPSWDLFEGHSADYRDSVLPPAMAARVSVEAASPLGWERYVGRRGTIIGMRSFGISAPGKVARAHFDFDIAHVVAAAREQIARHAQKA